MKLSLTQLSSVVEHSKSKNIVEIETHKNISEALDLMHKNRIQSLVVFGKPGHFVTAADPSLGIHRGKQYLAILTLLDLINYLLKNKGNLEAQVFEAIGSTAESLSLWMVRPSSNLLECLEPMAKGIHHFLVASTDENDKINFISQTDILIYIFEQIENNKIYQDHLSAEIQQMFDFEKQKVITCTQKSKMIDVLNTMNSNGIKSVPIVSESDGSLIDCFSTSGIILCINKSRFAKLHMGCLANGIDYRQPQYFG